MPHRPSTRTSILTPLLLAGFLLAAVVPAEAQPAERSGGTFYGKFGAGFSDYTGDFPVQNNGHPFDLQEFVRGSGFPFLATGEVGYQFSPSLTLGLGLQVGNYPIVGYGGGPSGISDSYRYTPQLLARYTIGHPGQRIAPYIDGGVNATFGGSSSTSVGYGPSAGLGVDILLSSTLSLFVESRFNFTLPDEAIDGANYSTASGGGSTNRESSVTGPFDSVNQLLGFGLKIRFSSATAPRVIAVNGPSEVPAGESATFTATVNESEVTRPMRYEWQFGDGETGSGLTATHTFEQPGTYTVDFSARTDTEKASTSTTVTVTQPATAATETSTDGATAKAPQITSVDVAPNPVAVGDSVQFTGRAEGSGPFTYKWSFGDGTSAPGASATHTYEEPGAYTVRWTAANEAGEETRLASVCVTRRAVSTSPAEPSKPWGIVIASMGTTKGAEAMAQRYRRRLDTSALPVETIVSETSRGLRLRVVVGQFDTEDAARQALREHEAVLPSGAWLVQRR